jgi:small conductance mechanosensitive channel
VVNHTKLRSGVVVELILAHHCGDVRQVLAVLGPTLAAFAADPAWQPSLLEAPELRGVTAADPRGLTVAVVLVTVAGAQGPAGRELRLRLLERLQQEAIPLADTP